ncbi:hypothetical protein DFP73DRAFT_536535, partial [Morchella snyderi]
MSLLCNSSSPLLSPRLLSYPLLSSPLLWAIVHFLFQRVHAECHSVTIIQPETLFSFLFWVISPADVDCST